MDKETDAVNIRVFTVDAAQTLFTTMNTKWPTKAAVPS